MFAVLIGGGLRFPAFPLIGDIVSIRVGSGGGDGHRLAGPDDAVRGRLIDHRSGGSLVDKLHGLFTPLGGCAILIDSSDTDPVDFAALVEAVAAVVAVPLQSHAVAVRVSGLGGNIADKLAVLELPGRFDCKGSDDGRVIDKLNFTGDPLGGSAPLVHSPHTDCVSAD